MEQISSPALAGNTPFSRGVKGSTPIPSPTSAGHHHHHHHHHVGPRSTTNQNARPAAPLRSPSPVVVQKPKQIISSKAVLDSVADRPRSHLGEVLYEPKLKRARLQDPRTGRPPRSGYSSTPRPLPWDLIEGKENCTLTMKIGKEHLVPAAREEITARRALWGSDVYTDDSDVIAACIHAGWIRGEWPEDVDVSMLGLDEGYSVSDVRGGSNLNGSKKPEPQPTSSSQTLVLTEPPKTGPMPVPENRDLHVTLLILPRLEKYASTTRFGIKSREFGGPTSTSSGENGLGLGQGQPQQRAVHDGISFMIIGLRWLTNGGTSQNRLRGKARRERIRKTLREIEMAPAWISGPLSVSVSAGNGGSNKNGGAGGEGEKGEVAGEEGQGGEGGENGNKTPSEGDKENMPVGMKSVGIEKENGDVQKPSQRQEESGKDEGDMEVVHEERAEPRKEDAKETVAGPVDVTVPETTGKESGGNGATTNGEARQGEGAETAQPEITATEV